MSDRNSYGVSASDRSLFASSSSVADAIHFNNCGAVGAVIDCSLLSLLFDLIVQILLLFQSRAKLIIVVRDYALKYSFGCWKTGRSVDLGLELVRGWLASIPSEEKFDCH